MSAHTDTTDTANPRTDRPTISHADVGTRLVFTEVDGTTDCWLSAEKSALVPACEWC